MMLAGIVAWTEIGAVERQRAEISRRGGARGTHMIFPLGPYHPALTEPMSLRLALRGEIVTTVETHLGYLHRGVEAAATARDLPATLDLVERICGTCGHSHRLALCLALERLADVSAPPRAEAMRSAFAEVERLLARLWLLMEIGRVGEFGALFTAAVEAREVLFEACEAATGSRLFWGIPLPGGALAVEDPGALAQGLTDIEPSIVAIERLLSAQGPILRRMLGVGKVTSTAVEDLRISGLVARGSGTEDDLRLAAPYCAYRLLADDLATDAGDIKTLTGDVASRLRLAQREIRQSMHAITTLLDDLPTGQDRATFPTTLPFGSAEAQVEGPHGRETVAVRVGTEGGRVMALAEPGWLTELRITPPSVANIGLIPIVLPRQRLSDVPLILASLDLCVACVDR
jgi:Ni,Fe-hydrogenase III large subunit